MKLKNILIVVKDIEKSKKFYHDLFGLDVLLDNSGNVIMMEGLVLQDEKIWKTFFFFIGSRPLLSLINKQEAYEKEVLFKNLSFLSIYIVKPCFCERSG